jgi:hypothetical protein
VENEWSAELQRADEITRFLLSFFAVVLLDTTKEDSLDWTRYPFGPQSATPGVSWTLFVLFVRVAVCVGVYVCVRDGTKSNNAAVCVPTTKGRDSMK